MVLNTDISFGQAYPTITLPNDWFVPAGRFVRIQPKDILMFDIEVNRLLLTEDASFGMTCVPSLSQEWAISVCESSKQLVVMRPGTATKQDFLWTYVRDAIYEMVDKGTSIEMRPRAKAKKYQAPPIHKQSLTVSDNAVTILRQLFTKALSSARHAESQLLYCPSDSWESVSIPLYASLDGTDWTVFLDGQCVKTHDSGNNGVRTRMFLNLMCKLRDAVYASDSARVEQLMVVANFIDETFNMRSSKAIEESPSVPHCDLLDTNERDVYLIHKAREAVHIFRDALYDDQVTAVVSDLKVFKSKNISSGSKYNGHKYFTVTFNYKTDSATNGWPFESKVDIWAESGVPFGIIFGNHWGYSFWSCPYSECLRWGSEQDMFF